MNSNTTYTFSEAVGLILKMDTEGVHNFLLLMELEETESKRYCLRDIESIMKICEYRVNELKKYGGNIPQ